MNDNTTISAVITADNLDANNIVRQANDHILLNTSVVNIHTGATYEGIVFIHKSVYIDIVMLARETGAIRCQIDVEPYNIGRGTTNGFKVWANSVKAVQNRVAA